MGDSEARHVLLYIRFEVSVTSDRIDSYLNSEGFRRASFTALSLLFSGNTQERALARTR
jgi:hypothetical protein